jgi:hypothetical protein
MFKKMRSVRLSYEKQGLVYFLCKNYTVLPVHIQETIDRLCMEVGGEYNQALRQLLIRRISVRRAAMEWHMDETTLYRKRKIFYERFYPSLFYENCR